MSSRPKSIHRDGIQQASAWAAGLLLPIGWFWAAWAGATDGGRVWQPGEGFRSASLPVSGGEEVGFTLLNPQETGLNFTNRLQGDMFLTNAVAHNGAGVAAADVDGDGWCDLYFCSLQGENRLYQNQGGWRFREITESAGVRCSDQLSTGAAFADVDDDDDADLLVNGITAGTRLFLNNGKGRFTEMTESGLSRDNSAISLALGDAGDLLAPGPQDGLSPGWRQFLKMDDIPNPSEIYVMLDEHPPTLNDGWFHIFPDFGTGDEIAYNHDGKATFSFADGHSESKQVVFRGDDRKTSEMKKNWLGPRSTLPFVR